MGFRAAHRACRHGRFCVQRRPNRSSGRRRGGSFRIRYCNKKLSIEKAVRTSSRCMQFEIDLANGSENRLHDRRGLSPLVRGHRLWTAERPKTGGSIPACAGSPAPPVAQDEAGRVYPRVCGVTASWDLSHCVKIGLSPRVRGHQVLMRCAERYDRSIPACAGSPNRNNKRPTLSEVYPRVYGVTPRFQRRSKRACGLSPRVRGHPQPKKAPRSTQGSIPACAGSPLDAIIAITNGEVYPRVCGVTCLGL